MKLIDFAESLIKTSLYDSNIAIDQDLLSKIKSAFNYIDTMRDNGEISVSLLSTAKPSYLEVEVKYLKPNAKGFVDSISQIRSYAVQSGGHVQAISNEGSKYFFRIYK